MNGYGNKLESNSCFYDARKNQTLMYLFNNKKKPGLYIRYF